MKKFAKTVVVITVALIVTAGVASANGWHACTPLGVQTYDLGDSVSTRIRVNDNCSAVKDTESKWISAPDSTADGAMAIVLTAITLNRKISFRVDGGLEHGYIPTVIAVGLH